MLLLLFLLWEVGVSCVQNFKTNCPTKIVASSSVTESISVTESQILSQTSGRSLIYESSVLSSSGNKPSISADTRGLFYTEAQFAKCLKKSGYVYVLEKGCKQSKENIRVLPKDCNDTSQQKWWPTWTDTCVYVCQSQDITCCLLILGSSHSKKEDNDHLEKVILGILIATLIFVVIVVIFVIVRKRIKRPRKRDDDSPANTKGTFTDDDEHILGTSGYTQTSDLEFGSGAYSLTSSENEGGRNYRPLRRPVRNKNPRPGVRHFDLRPSVHRAFEDDDDDDMYTKINDDEIDRDAADREKHDYAISCHDGAEMPYFVLECGEQGDSRTSYNRLGCHRDKDERTRTELVSERNYGRLRFQADLTNTSLCEENQLAKPMTEADFSSGKDEENSFHDDTASEAQYEKEAGPNTRHLLNQNSSTVSAAGVDGLIRESQEHSVHSETNMSACLPRKNSGTDDMEDTTTNSSSDCIKGDN